MCRPVDVNNGTQGSPDRATASSERKAGEMQLKATLTAMSALEPLYLSHDHIYNTPLAATTFTQAQMDATRSFQKNLNHLDAAVQRSTQKSLADS